MEGCAAPHLPLVEALVPDAGCATGSRLQLSALPHALCVESHCEKLHPLWLRVQDLEKGRTQMTRQDKK